MRQVKKEGDDSDKPANGEVDGCMNNTDDGTINDNNVKNNVVDSDPSD